ncbi:SDR family NAD(P)-dependent oxidoreductase, partial [Mesorhizobium sp. M4B.F.Ca.ET.049.02.1.2]|uniref:SDR family NAD(P)-dependent oxidoreductase n=1 Tax=Mesorhizobium sp. M4B.F.Ca.ET.049.02.1.2 TaxID=2496752 RepID=UPI000FCA56DF
TGYGRGLGRALAAFASQQGNDVVALVRTHTCGVLPCEVFEGVDVTDPQALDRIAAVLRDRPIDLLVNNAGIMGPERQSTVDMDFDGFRRALEVNTLAPLRVVQTFLPNLRAARMRHRLWHEHRGRQLAP